MMEDGLNEVPFSEKCDKPNDEATSEGEVEQTESYLDNGGSPVEAKDPVVEMDPTNVITNVSSSATMVTSTEAVDGIDVPTAETKREDAMVNEQKQDLLLDTSDWNDNGGTSSDKCTQLDQAGNGALEELSTTTETVKSSQDHLLIPSSETEEVPTAEDAAVTNADDPFAILTDELAAGTVPSMGVVTGNHFATLDPAPKVEVADKTPSASPLGTGTGDGDSKVKTEESLCENEDNLENLACDDDKVPTETVETNVSAMSNNSAKVTDDEDHFGDFGGVHSVPDADVAVEDLATSDCTPIDTEKQDEAATVSNGEACSEIEGESKNLDDTASIPDAEVTTEIDVTNDVSQPETQTFGNVDTSNHTKTFSTGKDDFGQFDDGTGILKEEETTEIDVINDASQPETNTSDKGDVSNNRETFSTGEDDFGQFDNAATLDNDPLKNASTDTSIASTFVAETHDDTPKSSDESQSARVDDDFGDFGTFSDAVIVSDTEVKTDDTVSDLGAETEAGKDNEVPLGNQEPPANDSDDFGNFNDVPVVMDSEMKPEENLTNVVTEIETENNVYVAKSGDEEISTNDDNNFGDFGGFTNFNDSHDMKETEAKSQTSFAENDHVNDTGKDIINDKSGGEDPIPNDEDDFGDFGDFEDSPTVTTPENKTADSSTIHEPQLQKINNDELNAFNSKECVDNDDDDFGDFGDFNDASIHHPESKAENNERALASDNENDFEGDENFNVGKQESDEDREIPLPLNGEKSDNDEDDFGDFGDFNNSAKSADLEPTPDDDTPGNNNLKANDEDDFGDFGEFNDSPILNAEEPAQNAMESSLKAGDNNFDATPGDNGTPGNNDLITNDEDDFGDFGDFNDAPTSDADDPENAIETSQKNSAEDDDFGDFGEFDGSGETTPSTHDPFLEKASFVFQRVFSRYTDSSKYDNDNTDDFTRIETTPTPLKNVLQSYISDDETEVDIFKPTDDLMAQLCGDIKLPNLPPNVIVASDPMYPFSHYTIQTGGKLKLDIKSRKENTFKEEIPDVQRIELPCIDSPDIECVDETKNKLNGAIPSTVNTENAVDGGNKNPLNSESLQVKNTSAGKIEEEVKDTLSASQRFLAKIPDLSFMLKSTLTLPKHAVQNSKPP